MVFPRWLKKLSKQKEVKDNQAYKVDEPCSDTSTRCDKKKQGFFQLMQSKRRPKTESMGPDTPPASSSVHEGEGAKDSGNSSNNPTAAELGLGQIADSDHEAEVAVEKELVTDVIRTTHDRRRIITVDEDPESMVDCCYSRSKTYGRESEVLPGDSSSEEEEEEEGGWVEGKDRQGNEYLRKYSIRKIASSATSLDSPRGDAAGIQPTAIVDVQETTTDIIQPTAIVDVQETTTDIIQPTAIVDVQETTTDIIQPAAIVDVQETTTDIIQPTAIVNDLQPAIIEPNRLLKKISRWKRKPDSLSSGSLEEVYVSVTVTSSPSTSSELDPELDCISVSAEPPDTHRTLVTSTEDEVFSAAVEGKDSLGSLEFERRSQLLREADFCPVKRALPPLGLAPKKESSEIIQDKLDPKFCYESSDPSRSVAEKSPQSEIERFLGIDEETIITPRYKTQLSSSSYYYSTSGFLSNSLNESLSTLGISKGAVDLSFIGQDEASKAVVLGRDVTRRDLSSESSEGE